MADTILESLNELNQKLTDQGAKMDTLTLRIAPEGQSVQNTLHLATVSGTGKPYLSYLQELEAIRKQLQVCCSSEIVGSDIGDLTPTETSAKCAMANLIWDTTYDVFDGLERDHADEYATKFTSLGVGAMVGAIGALIINPVAGFAVGLVALAVAFLTGAGLLSLTDMLQSLNENKEAIICGLLNSVNPSGARDVFANEMTSVTGVELFFINLLLTNDFLNNLFNGNSVPEDYTPSYNCSTCDTGGIEPLTYCDPVPAGRPTSVQVTLDGDFPVNGTYEAVWDGFNYAVSAGLVGNYHINVHITAYEAAVTLRIYPACTNSGAACYENTNWSSGVISADRFGLLSTDPFTVSLTFNDQGTVDHQC